jgi:hypothetical protein
MFQVNRLKFYTVLGLVLGGCILKLLRSKFILYLNKLEYFQLLVTFILVFYIWVRLGANLQREE